ncbi:MAG TPA: SGNH/GDSL hydrolase family protein [Flavisolibacter sp.]|nr:SGNH/GDSL hydrolase family protein [Flavisolibacter sp.]
MKKLLKLIATFLLLCTTTFAQQQKPFWNEITDFKRTDSAQAPPKNAILFTGSSSFRLWKDVQQAFPKHTIINRGFGGSSLPHAIQYADEIIFPYQPKQVVVYCGENDFGAGDSITGQTVFQRFQQLFSLIRERLPKTKITFVSMKPSPSRWHLKEKMETGNKLIKDFLKKQKKASYVDVWTPMLNDEGKPREELFVGDKLHMNEKGYAIWQEKILPHLKD